jgi:hemerythrin superfamily protein
MKATKLLSEQHEKVKKLLKELPEAPAKRQRELFEKVAAELTAHDAIERRLFYPAVEAAMGMTPILGESLVEHGVIEFMLYRADRALDGDEFSYEAKVLCESVLHHAEEEEEELFPEVERAIDNASLTELGEQMKTLFERESQLEQVLKGGMKTEAKAKANGTGSATKTKSTSHAKAPSNGKSRTQRSHA